MDIFVQQLFCAEMDRLTQALEYALVFRISLSIHSTTACCVDMLSVTAFLETGTLLATLGQNSYLAFCENTDSLQPLPSVPHLKPF